MNYTVRSRIVAILMTGLLVCVGTVRSAYIDEVNADGPSAYYRFEDPTSADGDAAADETGSFDGTYTNGVARVAGVPVIGGLAIDVKDQDPVRYVSQPSSFNSFGGEMDDGYGIELWVRTTDTSDDKPLLGTLAQNGSDHTGFSIELNRRGDNFDAQPRATLFFLRDHTSNFNDFSFHIDHTSDGNIDIYDGQWHHLFWNATDPATHRADVYIDGQPQTLTIGRTQSPALGDPFQYDSILGNRNIRGAPADSGPVATLDEVAYYADSLSSERIQAHYLAGVPEPSVAVLAGLVLCTMLGRGRPRSCSTGAA